MPHKEMLILLCDLTFFSHKIILLQLSFLLFEIPAPAVTSVLNYIPLRQTAFNKVVELLL